MAASPRTYLHAAIRGAIPRKLLRQVIKATYATVWWPRHDRILYTRENLPIWDHKACTYLDSNTGTPLRTWDQALDELYADDQAVPAHVVRFGTQCHMEGIIGGSPQADRRVGYLAKYLTKAITDPLDEAEQNSPEREAHIDRLHAEVRMLPCSPRCWNWLAYAIQPKDAAEGMRPGECPARAHDREHLGCGGRRVLVSRKWTGKTLSDHKADRRSAVQVVLEAAGIDIEDVDHYSATQVRDDGKPRYAWYPVDRDDLPTYTDVIAAAVAERQRWRTQYEQAKERAGPDLRASSAVRPAAMTTGGQTG